MNQQKTYYNDEQNNETSDATDSTRESLSEFELQSNTPTTKPFETLYSSSTNISFDLDSSKQLNKENDGVGKQHRFNKNKAKICSLLVSYKFMIPISISVFILHIIIWAIIGGIDEAVYNTTGKRSVMDNIGMFSAYEGCRTASNAIFIVGGMAIIYALTILAFVIALFFTDRDTWGIKIENLMVVTAQILLLIIFIPVSQVYAVVSLTDYFFPVVYSLLILPIIEIFIAVLLPIVYAIIHDSKSNENENVKSEIEFILKNKKSFPILLDFARRR